MKKLFILFVLFMVAVCHIQAGIYDQKWSKVATGQSDSWYGTDEAVAVAENVLLYQRNNGGWHKNIEMHQPLTDSEKQVIAGEKNKESCLDNTATTQEMRFLAKVYKHVKDDRYQAAFLKGLNMIIKAQLSKGGWAQYYPYRGRGYWDYITFNDNLTVNCLKLLWDIYEGKNEFSGIVNEAAVASAKSAYDKGLQCILDCQIVDEGVKTVWCAQHDPITLDAAVGRPHEHPSFSGGESVDILEFLMDIENPSEAVQEAVIAGVKWMDEHKIENKRVVDIAGDRVIQDAEGYNIWPRFIQLGGEVADRVYTAHFAMLESSGRTNSYSYGGNTYYYKDADNARNSYNPDMAYRPIFGIYDDSRPYLRYKFLYNYADSEKVADENGVLQETSLGADNRSSYQYISGFASGLNGRYEQWKIVNGITDGTEDASKVTISKATNTGDWNFYGGYSIGNENGKGYSNREGNTVKYSSGVRFTMKLPDGVQVNAVKVYGYCNYEEGSYLSLLGTENYKASDYVFPGKVDGGSQYVTHEIAFQTPVERSMPFMFAGKQVAVEMELTISTTSGVKKVTLSHDSLYNVYTLDGQILKTNVSLEEVENLPRGMYVLSNGIEGRIVPVK